MRNSNIFAPYHIFTCAKMNWDEPDT